MISILTQAWPWIVDSKPNSTYDRTAIIIATINKFMLTK